MTRAEYVATRAKWDVTWVRPKSPDEVLECHDLSSLQLIRRLAAAVQLNGPVLIVSVRASEVGR